MRFCLFLFMKINDLDKKVIGRFFKEITINGHEDEDITYIFPDTKEFISVVNRRFVSKKVAAEEKI